MVHALEEIRRVLVDGGTLIDLRPIAEAQPVEVVSSRATQECGHVTQLPEDIEDDAAANGAMTRGEAAALFRREQEEYFPFYYSWDSPDEMKAFVEEEWADFAEISEAVWARTRSLWAVADADARVRVRLKMLITRWRKAA